MSRIHWKLLTLIRPHKIGSVPRGASASILQFADKMDSFFRLVGPNRAIELFGVRLVGMNTENGKKLLFSFTLIVIIFVLRRTLHSITRRLIYGRGSERLIFWIRQGIKLSTTILLILGLVSIWFDDPTRLTTAIGLVTAGLAFALQKVITAIAGYFVILRGRTFNVGDRITMGGVRGDVIALDFTQTTLMEMGQPPAVQAAEPAMWVRSRQYTGRIVTVTNAKIFDEPIFNYSREFPYIWEEMSIPISYTSDRKMAEKILLEVAERYTVRTSQLSNEALLEMQRRYFMKLSEMTPKVYYRITDNWLELTVRFIVAVHGIREVKDLMGRDIIQAFDEAKIGIASATFEIVGLPPFRLEEVPRQQSSA